MFNTASSNFSFAPCCRKIQLFADDVLMRGEPKEMMLLGIMSTPAVVIDGRVMCAGRVPSGQEVREWIAGGADGGR